MLQTGQILDGKYRIIRELGSGAMGAVYEGENLRIHRRVAIKVLLPALADNLDTVRRFEREAQAAGRIGSDHIVEVLDLGILADGGFFMVMEFLEGMTLRQRIRSRGRLRPREIVPIAQQLLFGLEMAHEAGIIHRDLKPDNVFLTREHMGQPDFVKILDFGVSKFNPLHVEEGLSMTRTGAVVGTPFYMSPEQAKGSRDIDARSDLYSVGVILFESVTGQVPFHAGTFNELIFKIVLETPPPPETFVPDLDPAFGRVIRRAMARDRADRFATAAEFRDALSVWLHTGRDSVAPPEVVPPPGLGWDDDKGTLVAGQTGQGTHLMAPEDVATRNLQPPDAPTRVASAPATQLVVPPTQLVRPAEQGPPRTQPMRAPPPSRPAPPSRRKPDLIPSPPPPPPHALEAARAHAPLPYGGVALTPSHLPHGAPTPVGMRRGDEHMLIAGVPPRNPGFFAVAVGVIGAITVGAVAGIVLLSPPGAETESSAEPAAEAAPEAAHAGDEDEETMPGQTEDESAAASPSASAAAEPNGASSASQHVPATTRPAARPPAPRPAPLPPPPPKPAPAPTTSKQNDSTGRRIKTEL